MSDNTSTPVADGCGPARALLERPSGNNADEWAAFLEEWLPSVSYVAVQIAEAIDDAERRAKPAQTFDAGRVAEATRLHMAEIEGEEIVIRVALSSLSVGFGAACAKHYGDHRLFICDEVEFRKDFVNALNSENEVGDTLVHFMLDRAAVNVVEGGSISLDDYPHTDGANIND